MTISEYLQLPEIEKDKVKRQVWPFSGQVELDCALGILWKSQIIASDRKTGSSEYYKFLGSLKDVCDTYYHGQEISDEIIEIAILSTFGPIKKY